MERRGLLGVGLARAGMCIGFGIGNFVLEVNPRVGGLGFKSCPARQYVGATGNLGVHGLVPARV